MRTIWDLWQEGRHDEAERHALATYAIGEKPFVRLAMSNLSFLLFFLRREQGRLDEMETAVREFATSHADIPSIRVALALLLAETGRHDDARGLLDAILARDLHRLRDRNWPSSWFQLARAAFIVDARDLASELAREQRRPTERCIQVSLATVCLGAAELASAWILHTLGTLDAADSAYRAAATTNAEIGARCWLAQTWADHAGMLLDRSGPDDVAAATAAISRSQLLADDVGLVSVIGTLDRLRSRMGRLDRQQALRPSSDAIGVFRRAGHVWELEFAGRSCQVRHGRGLDDLAYLLARPGRAVSVYEFLTEAGAVAGGPAGADLLDERARREIRERLEELDEVIAEAEDGGDTVRGALAREQRQQLAEAVARDLGLGGRSRRFNDPLERARKTVSARIRRAITAIGTDHPELARHLDRSIDSGAWCAYRPAEPVTWTTS